jgi:hypothetical protein
MWVICEVWAYELRIWIKIERVLYLGFPLVKWVLESGLSDVAIVSKNGRCYFFLFS